MDINTHTYVTALKEKDAMNYKDSKWELHGRALKVEKGKEEGKGRGKRKWEMI